MDLYIVRELSLFFSFSVSLITLLGVAIGTLSELADKISEYQLPLVIASQIFGCKIPEYAAYGLPISILLTCLVIYGRLNSDCELVALRSFGISSYRLVLPALIFSLTIAGATFVLNELIVPAANYRANLLQSPFIPQSELNLQKQDIFYAEYILGCDRQKKLKHLYFAELYDRPNLLKLLVVSFKSDRAATQEHQLDKIITAKSAQWNQQQQAWDLTAGSIYYFSPEVEKSSVEEFVAKQLVFPQTIFEIAARERSPEEMNIRQAREYLNLIEDTALPKEIAQYAVRIQQKYAFPFISVVFALIGAALGAKYNQLNRAKGFGLCVGIVFAYYFLGFAIGSVGITGSISPWLAGWLPNIIGLAVGTYLLRSANS